MAEKTYPLEIERIIADIQLKLAQHSRVQQEVTLEPWKVVIGGLTAGGALLGGGVALGAFLTSLFS